MFCHLSISVFLDKNIFLGSCLQLIIVRKCENMREHFLLLFSYYEYTILYNHISGKIVSPYHGSSAKASVDRG